MSDALSVLLVPDADETTRQVLSALRTAALAAEGPTTPSASGDEDPTMLLRWNRRDDPSVRLGDDLRPVRADDGRVLYYESTLTGATLTDADAPKPPASADDLVAPLLAFVAAAEQARTRSEACQAAVVAAEQVLGADRVFVLMQTDEGVTMESCSFGFAAETRASLTEAEAWTTYRLPRISAAVPALGRETDVLIPAIVRLAMQQEGMSAALALPLLHRHLPEGVVWALFQEPQSFDMAARQRGGLLAHHLSGTLAHVRDRAQASVGPADPEHQYAERAADAARPPLPVKTLLGLAAAAAYGLERTEKGDLQVAWATKSLRDVLGVHEEADLDVDTITAAIAEEDRTALFDAYASLEVGASIRLEHPITLAAGEARQVRHALQRVREDGRDQLLAVLVDLGPALDDEPAATEQAAASSLDAPLLASLGQALRMPLTAVLDEADALTRTSRLDAENCQRAARHIAAEGRRLMSTLNLVVDLARIESGAASLVRSDLVLGHELRKVLGLLEPLAAKRALTLEVDLDVADRTAVHQDATALSRVLHHLVGTAIAEAAPGVLRVRVQSDARMARVELEADAAPERAVGSAVMHQPFGGVIAERLVARMDGTWAETKDDRTCRWTLALPTVERTPAPAIPAPAVPVSVTTEPAVLVLAGSVPADRPPPSLQSASAAARDSEAPELASALSSDEEGMPLPDPEEGAAPSLADLDALFPMPSAGDGGPPATSDGAVEAVPPRGSRHAFTSIEAAANAFRLAEDPRFTALDATVSDTHAVTVDPTGDTEREADRVRPEPRYERTEVALPVGVRLPSPPRDGLPESPTAPSEPVADDMPSATDTAPRAFDTALDAFASVDPNHIDAGVEASVIETFGTETPSAREAGEHAAEALPAELAGRTVDEDGTPPPVATAPGRVLIVEDNPETRLLLERLIGREFETVAVASSRAALDKLTQQQFHALVLDIHLGGRETGVDILRIARTLDGYADTFAMAVTAFGERADRDRFLEAGFNAYVQKPFVPEALLAPLREALQLA